MTYLIISYIIGLYWFVYRKNDRPSITVAIYVWSPLTIWMFIATSIIWCRDYLDRNYKGDETWEGGSWKE